MSEVLKWMALGEMTQRSRIGGGTYVLLADFDAEHALRLEAERQVGELREQMVEVISALETAYVALVGYTPAHRNEVIDRAIGKTLYTLSLAKSQPSNSDKDIR